METVWPVRIGLPLHVILYGLVMSNKGKWEGCSSRPLIQNRAIEQFPKFLSKLSSLLLIFGFCLTAGKWILRRIAMYQTQLETIHVELLKLHVLQEAE